MLATSAQSTRTTTMAWDAVKAAASLSHGKAAAAHLATQAQEHILAMNKAKADPLNEQRADLLKTAKAA